MNLALEKGEKVAMGDKGRGEIRREAVTEVVANVSTTNGLEKGMGHSVDGG